MEFTLKMFSKHQNKLLRNHLLVASKAMIKQFIVYALSQHFWDTKYKNNLDNTNLVKYFFSHMKFYQLSDIYVIKNTVVLRGLTDICQSKARSLSSKRTLT